MPIYAEAGVASTCSIFSPPSGEGNADGYTTGTESMGSSHATPAASARVSSNEEAPRFLSVAETFAELSRCRGPHEERRGREELGSTNRWDNLKCEKLDFAY